MANENLKVNARTDILEFKRKHNLLVENGTVKANVSDIKSLSNEVIDNLRCGDVVLKEDTSGKHAYLVSFKSDTGLCLTYCDASCIETQSYDKSGDNWVYNSEDKTSLPINGEFVGNIKVTGDFEVTGKINNVANPSFKPIYWHGLDIYNSSLKNSLQAHVLKNDNIGISDIDKLLAWVISVGSVKLSCCGSYQYDTGYWGICHFIRFTVSGGAITSISIYYCTPTGGYFSDSVTVEQFKTKFTSCDDSSNKIN